MKLFEVELNISYTKSTDLQVEARNLSNLGVAETHTLTAQPLVARMPLGATFSLRLTKPGTLPQGVNAQWSTGVSSLASGVAPETLFPDNVLLEYDKNGPAGELKHYLAVHEGTVPITITPTDPKLDKHSVTVQVYAPNTLGAGPHIISDGVDSYDLDAEIARWSHARGVPPQAVKAIMRNETLPAFNTKTWRYEPLSTDWDEFSPNGQDKRTLAEFALYRMEYDATHDRGIALVDSQDVHPRSIFYRDFATHIKVADADQLVTAYTLFTQNDRTQHWLSYVTPSKRNLILQDPHAVLDWSAQTTLAASYGLMQVLFEESFLQGWAGIGGSLRPYYLFDLPGNVNNGGGSIETGSGLLVSKFNMANSVQSYHDSDEFDNALLRALSCYNSCNLKRRPITSYGHTAFDNMALCMPSADMSIFQLETP